MIKEPLTEDRLKAWAASEGGSEPLYCSCCNVQCKALLPKTYATLLQFQCNKWRHVMARPPPKATVDFFSDKGFYFGKPVKEIVYRLVEATEGSKRFLRLIPID